MANGVVNFRIPPKLEEFYLQQAGKKRMKIGEYVRYCLGEYHAGALLQETHEKIEELIANAKDIQGTPVESLVSIEVTKLLLTELFLKQRDPIELADIQSRARQLVESY